MELEILKMVLDHWGPVGTVLLVIFGTPAYMAWTYHKTRVSELKQSADEHRAEKADYKNIITGNTEAITKLAGALEANTEATRDLQHEVRGLKQP